MVDLAKIRYTDSPLKDYIHQAEIDERGDLDLADTLAKKYNLTPKFFQDIEFRMRWEKNYIIEIYGDTGIGKCQKKGSKVLMSNGDWKKIENIKIGEKVVSPSLDGNKSSFSKVIDKSEYYSPELFKVIENKKNPKNRKTLYECTPNHLIPVTRYKEIRKTIIGGKRKHLGFEEFEKNYLAEELFNFKKNYLECKNFRITQGVFINKFENAKNPEIDPYTLGIYLGDGCFNAYLDITTNTFSIIDKINKKYLIMSSHNKKNTSAKSFRFSLKSLLAKQLTELGLRYKLSGTKFIPEICKRADYKYRIKLLEGLIDSDGFVNKFGGIIITLKSQKLINDIIFIVRSLGGKARIKKVKKKCCNNGKIGTYFTTSINLNNFHRNLNLKDSKKKKRLLKFSGKFQNPKMRKFLIKKSKGSKVIGITLNNKSQLYITDNFVITTNRNV